MVQQALDRGYEVVGVCREKSVAKLDDFKNRITIIPGATNDRDVIKRAVSGCDGVLSLLVPWGVQQYSSGTAQAVMDFSEPNARLIFSCGWHISRDGKDMYSWKLKALVKIFGGVARLFRLVELNDQVVYGVIVQDSAGAKINRGYAITFKLRDKVWYDTVFLEMSTGEAAQSESVFAEAVVDDMGGAQFEVTTFDVQ